MLLPISHPATQALLSPHFRVIPEAVITTPRGLATQEFQDVTDSLLAYSIANSLNDAAGTGVFTFARGSGRNNLSPLIAASSRRFSSGRPLLDPHCEINLNIRILTGTGFEVGSVRRLTGRIDRVNVAASGTTVSVQCRDIGARYLNKYMKQAQGYGPGQAEAVMSQILSLNGFAEAFTGLQTPVSPGYMVTQFFSGEISVMESLRILAQQIGWDLRWFEVGAGGIPPSGLRFYDPGRSRSTPDLILGPTRYSGLTELSIGDEDVRNSWDVYYPNAATPAHAEDPISINRYGLREAVIGEQRTLNITTAGPAQTLAAVALADSKDPFASHEVRMPILPIVELNDLHLYQANGVEYDTDLTRAVAAYREDWKAGPGMATTTISARAQPIAAYREYRKGVEPKVIVSNMPPDATRYASEGAVWEYIPGLALP